MTKYYRIETLGDLTDANLCILDKPPEGIGVKYYRMAKGEPIGSDYPVNAAIYMSDKYPGIKLCSLLGNTNSYLIVAREMKDVIEANLRGDIEYLPFTLYNHKRRAYSKDYFIINPIGTHDCLDLNGSEIEYLEGEVVGIDKYVLDPDKLSNAPCLFRIQQEPRSYIFREDLVKACRDKAFSNLVFTEMEQAVQS